MTLVRRSLLLSVPIVALVLAPQARADGRESAIVTLANEVLKEFNQIPEKGIPAALMADAQGVAVFPDVVKAGFVLGGRHGRGVLLVRDPAGNWANPVFVVVSGGSVGWQAGVQSTDVVLVFKNRGGVDGLLKRRKVTLGADAGVAAGPIGRKAEAATDAQLKSEIYSYSRSRGLFLGVSLEGSVLRIDPEGTDRYYEQRVNPAELMAGKPIPVRESTLKLKATLAALAPPTLPAVAPTVPPLPTPGEPPTLPTAPTTGPPISTTPPPAVVPTNPPPATPPLPLPPPPPKRDY
jgi:lipid-binding SYLF domain-containing protein